MVDRKHILKRLREWRKEDLLKMKQLVEGMTLVGGQPEILSEFRFHADSSARLKKLIKIFE